jgi:Lysine methyltransferase
VALSLHFFQFSLKRDTRRTQGSRTQVQVRVTAMEDEYDEEDGRTARNLFRTGSDSSSSSSDEPEEEENESSVTRRNGGSTAAAAAAARGSTCTTAAAEPQQDEETKSNSSSLYMRHCIDNLVLETQGAGGGSIAQRLWPAAQHLADFVLEIMMSNADEQQQRATGVKDDETEQGEQSQHDNKHPHEPLSSQSSSTSTTKTDGKGFITTTTTCRTTSIQRTQPAIHARTQLQQILWHEERLFLVELGAGVGLTGLVLATSHASTRRLTAVHVLLTDLDEAMTLLQRNIASNQSQLFPSSTTTANNFNDDDNDNNNNNNNNTITTIRTAQAQPLQWGVLEDYEMAMAWYRRVASVSQYKSPESSSSENIVFPQPPPQSSSSSLCDDETNAPSPALAPPAAAGAPPILFLGSDLVYWECLYEPLEHALYHVLLQAPIGSLCLLAGMRRWKRDTAFYKSMGKRTSRTSSCSWQLQCTCIQEEITTTTTSKVDNANNGVRDNDDDERRDCHVAETTDVGQRGRREILRIYVVELVCRRHGR